MRPSRTRGAGSCCCGGQRNFRAFGPRPLLQRQGFAPSSFAPLALVSSISLLLLLLLYFWRNLSFGVQPQQQYKLGELLLEHHQQQHHRPDILEPSSASVYSDRESKLRFHFDGVKNNNDNDDGIDPLISSKPTHEACMGYTGIYHVAMTDVKGGAGTALLQLVLGQLLYAAQQNLKPWVHLLNNVSEVIYDPIVHGVGKGAAAVAFRAMGGRNATVYHMRGGHWRDAAPGPLDSTQRVSSRLYRFEGSGIWTHYFEPVSDFVPGDRSCEKKLYVTLGMRLITPGLHGYSAVAIRCWRLVVSRDYSSYRECQRANANTHMLFESW